METVYAIVAAVENEFLYLAYGSNMHPTRIASRCPSAKFWDLAIWPKRQLKFHKIGRDSSGKGNANWTGSKEDFILGVVYRIKLSDKSALDRAENLGQGYENIPLTLNHDAQIQRALTYVAQDKYIQEGILPFDWYLQYLIQASRHFSFPQAYIQALLKTPGQTDSDGARRSLEMDRAKQVKHFSKDTFEPKIWEVHEAP